MLSILLVNLLLHLLQFIGLLFFLFYGICGILSFRVSYFHHPQLQSCMLIQMRIRQVILQIANLLLVFVYFWMILSILGRERNKLLFLNLLQRQSIRPWHLLLSRLLGYVGYLLIWVSPLLILFLCLVTTRVLFKLLTTQSFINGPNTQRLIIIPLVTIFSLELLVCLLFLHPCKLQIYLPNLSMLLAALS